MKLKKYLLSMILMILCVFSFFGCAEVTFYRAIDGNNTIVDKLEIVLDKEKIESAGKSVDYVAGVINSDFTVFKSGLEDWKTQFILEDYPDLYERVKNGIKCTNDWIGLKLTITVEFADFTMFGLFYGISNIEGHEYQKALSDVGPFLSKMLMENGTNENMGFMLEKYSMIKDSGIIANLESLDDNGDEFYRDLYIKYRDLMDEKYDVKDLQVSQVFAYPDDDVYANADMEEYYGGLKFFGWEMSGKGDDFQMEIYRLVPRAVNWYVVALIISAIVVVVLIVNFGKQARNEKLITREDLEKDGK